MSPVVGVLLLLAINVVGAAAIVSREGFNVSGNVEHAPDASTRGPQALAADPTGERECESILLGVREIAIKCRFALSDKAGVLS